MNQEKCSAIFSESGASLFLVGYSGGADSTAALLCTCDWAARHHDAKVIAVHFNHGLRGAESDAEAEDAARFAGKLGVEFRLVKLDIPRNGNLENAARQCRLDYWRKAVKDLPAAAVVLGHHADDRLENLFMRLGRGGNLSSLTSLRSITELDGVRILRPLLGFSRVEIEKFLHCRGITVWAQDSSNRDEAYLRNLLRNRLLPEYYRALPGGKNGVLKALENLGQDADFIESAAADYFAGGNPALPDFWKSAHQALHPRLLRLWIRHEFGTDRPLPGTILRRFETALAAKPSPEGRLIPLGKHLMLKMHPQIFRLADGNTPPSQSWFWRETPEVIWGDWRLQRCLDTSAAGVDRLTPDRAVFDMAALPDELQLIAPYPGAAMIPFGKKNPVKIKKLRIDRKISSISHLPLLCDTDGRVLWAPLIRHSDLAKIQKRYANVVLFGIFPLKKR